MDPDKPDRRIVGFPVAFVDMCTKRMEEISDTLWEASVLGMYSQDLAEALPRCSRALKEMAEKMKEKIGSSDRKE